MGSRRPCAVTPSGYVSDAIVSEHAEMGCNGYQLGVIAVRVDLHQVAALPVDDPDGKHRAVTEFVQYLYFGGIRTRQVNPGHEGAALGDGPSCGRIVGKRVEHIVILGRTEHAQPRTVLERTCDATGGADGCLVVVGDGYGPARGAEGIAQFAGEQLESAKGGRGPNLVEQGDETGDQVVGRSPP